MLKEQFEQQRSRIHSFDLRIKILAVLWFAILAVMVDKVLVLGQLMVAAFLLLVISNLSFKLIFKRLLIINTFILLIWLVLPVTYPGSPLLSLGMITISKAGLLYALRITLRTNAIMILILGLLNTAKITSLIRALQQLYIPQKIIYLLFLVVRYLPVVKLEATKLLAAMKLRGFEKKTSWRSYKTIAYLIAILLVKSYERAQRIYQAMLCRGFSGKLHIKDEFNFKVIDLLMLLIIIIFSSWLLGLEKGLIQLC